MFYENFLGVQAIVNQHFGKTDSWSTESFSSWQLVTLGCLLLAWGLKCNAKQVSSRHVVKWKWHGDSYTTQWLWWERLWPQSPPQSHTLTVCRQSYGIKSITSAAPVCPVCVCIFCAHAGMHNCVRESVLWIQVENRRMEREAWQSHSERRRGGVKGGGRELQLFWRQSRSTEQQTFPFWAAQHEKTGKKR